MSRHSAMAMKGYDGRGRPILGDWWERVSCEDAECRHYLMGFKTSLDETREDMKEAADWIRHKSGLHFRESHEAGLTVLEFPPGQRCFREHKQPTGKPGKLSREGSRGVYTFTRGTDFNESMNEDAYAASRGRS